MAQKFFFIVVFVAAFFASVANAYENPGAPSGFVNDYAGVFSSEERAGLEGTLRTLEHDSGNEISVVTVKNLGGDTIENFAVKLFEDWGIGKKEKDNGILLLVALEDRQMRIEVGYGLEGALTDAQANWIIRNVMRPAFQQEKYYEGVSGALEQIMAATRGEYVPSENEDVTNASSFSWFDWMWFIIFFIFPLLGAILGRTKSFWFGGVLGGIGGIIAGWMIGTWLAVIGLLIVFAAFGLFFDYIFSRGHVKGWHGPWTGGFGGGPSSGGFGGFSGGSSGGGGSSGNW